MLIYALVTAPLDAAYPPVWLNVYFTVRQAVWDSIFCPTHANPSVLSYICWETPLVLKQGKPGEKYLRQTAYPMTSRRGVSPKLGAEVAPRLLTNI